MKYLNIVIITFSSLRMRGEGDVKELNCATHEFSLTPLNRYTSFPFRLRFITTLVKILNFMVLVYTTIHTKTTSFSVIILWYSNGAWTGGSSSRSVVDDPPLGCGWGNDKTMGSITSTLITTVRASSAAYIQRWETGNNNLHGNLISARRLMLYMCVGLIA